MPHMWVNGRGGWGVFPAALSLLVASLMETALFRYTPHRESSYPVWYTIMFGVSLPLLPPPDMHLPYPPLLRVFPPLVDCGMWIERGSPPSPPRLGVAIFGVGVFSGDGSGSFNVVYTSASSPATPNPVGFTSVV